MPILVKLDRMESSHHVFMEMSSQRSDMVGNIIITSGFNVVNKTSTSMMLSIVRMSTTVFEAPLLY